MNYQFLSVGQFQGREYAYMLDVAKNCVVRMPIYDAQVQHALVPPAPNAHIPPTPMPTRDEMYHAPELQYYPPESSPQPRADLPDKIPSIMPPGLAAMMRDGNEIGPHGY